MIHVYALQKWQGLRWSYRRLIQVSVSRVMRSHVGLIGFIKLTHPGPEVRVMAHGGRIGVRSQAGHRTMFAIRLPLARK